ncbi:MAG: DNA-3-methyladenine glycosylase [Bacteroidales bacterium]|nr:DNA-3-methyladenine glycosylase [Bacteroidales bacterium]
MPILNQKFFDRDVLKVAPELIGKIIIREFDDGRIARFRITQTEAYRGEDDKACHANKGRTPRTEIMYHQPGIIYVYLIYGMYWMLNFVTEKPDIPQAVLIRAVEGYNGPGKLTKALQIDKTFNDQSIADNHRIQLFDDLYQPKIITAPRIGVDYAGEVWAQKPWRFIDKNLS